MTKDDICVIMLFVKSCPYRENAISGVKNRSFSRIDSLAPMLARDPDGKESSMNQNLLIVGAGVYALVAKEIAESMGCFGEIAFADDNAKTTPNGIAVIGKSTELEALSEVYGYMTVAIGNPEVRLRLLERIAQLPDCRVATLISPRAYVSPSAMIAAGSIIEPMAVLNTGCVLERGCIVSAGAAVNHCAWLGEGVHIDCNATVAGNVAVPAKTKVCSGEVFCGERVDATELFSAERS